jgi:hypothetical protein
MFRKLRIAFSIVCGIVCLSLIALWVRSYSWCDLYNRQVSGHISRFRLISMKGYIHVLGSCMTVGSTDGFRSYPASNVYFESNEFLSPGEGFKTGGAFRFVSTHWLPILLMAFSRRPHGYRGPNISAYAAC